MDQQKLTDITYKYFNPQFLENEFSDRKSELFGLFGYEKLIRNYTTEQGLVNEGGIRNYEITDIQKDNSKNTITVYITMDTYELNTVKWIEWRKIPGKGWKINALSFGGKIESLETPLSPKKDTN